MLVSLKVYLAVTVLQISIERFSPFIIQIMKKLLLLFLCTAFQMQSMAQKWEIDEHQGDELRGTESYFSYSFTDEQGNSFIFWSNSNAFRIITGNGVFDYTTSRSGNLAYRKLKITVGYYDNNGALVNKKNIQLLVEDNAQFASKPLSGQKKLIQYIKEEQGYVRILAPLYARNIPYELKIPCLNNQE